MFDADLCSLSSSLALPSPPPSLLCRITNVLSDALIPRGCTVSDLLLKMFLIVGAWYTMQNVVQFTLSAAAAK